MDNFHGRGKGTEEERRDARAKINGNKFAAKDQVTGQTRSQEQKIVCSVSEERQQQRQRVAQLVPVNDRRADTQVEAKTGLRAWAQRRPE